MRCINCNTEFPDGMQVCPNCGAPAMVQSKDTVPLNRASSASLQETQYPQQPQQAPPPQPQQVPPPQQPQQAPPPQYQQSYNQQPYNQPPKSGSGAKWFVIGLLGLLFLALCGFIAWLLINKNKENEEEKKAKIEAIEAETKAVKEEAQAMRDSIKAVQENVKHDTVVIVEHETQVQTPPPPPPPRQQVNARGKGRWPFTSTRYLDPSELYGMGAWDLKIMRNEIYARHGYIFQTEDMRNYFNSQSWYTPVTRNVKLSKIEEYNVQLIKEFE